MIRVQRLRLSRLATAATTSARQATAPRIVLSMWPRQAYLQDNRPGRLSRSDRPIIRGAGYYNEREKICDPSHPRPPDRARAERHGQGTGDQPTTTRHRGDRLEDGMLFLCFFLFFWMMIEPGGDRTREQTAYHPPSMFAACVSRRLSRSRMKACRFFFFGVDKALFQTNSRRNGSTGHQNLIRHRTARCRPPQEWRRVAGNKACRDDRPCSISGTKAV